MKKTTVILLMLALSACATDTALFEPGRKESIEQEIRKQSGRRGVYSGMPCDEYCELTGRCNTWDLMRARRHPGHSCRIHNPTDFYRR